MNISEAASILPRAGEAPILDVRDLRVHFTVSDGVIHRTTRTLRAVDGVSFRLHRGETLGLVGESGCGKSTTARAILRLVPITAGSARLDLGPAGGPSRWVDLSILDRSTLRRARQHIQMIFQDPYASLNPRMTVGSIIAEPMTVYRLYNRPQRRRRVQQLMDEVGLDPKFIRRYPHEFSGGQRQRIGIARALALDPEVIICDEPVSALDVSIRSQVLNLLRELQERRRLSYLFIAHDLSVVKKVSHRVAVMYLGKIVEEALASDIYSTPLHPYTEALLSAIPIPDPEVESARRRIILSGDLPSPTATRHGCDFASRCPKVLPQECPVIPPRLEEERPGHRVACLLYETSRPPAAGGDTANHPVPGV